MADIAALLSGLAVGGWCYVTFLHGMFWRVECPVDSQDGTGVPGEVWPDVAILVPARNEAQTLPRTLPSLAAQDYPGAFRILVIDDHSADATRAVVRRLAKKPGMPPIQLIASPPLPKGWSGKSWALHQGMNRLAAEGGNIEYWLLTDADIHHPKASLRRLVRTARQRSCDLVSQMAMLDGERLLDRMLGALFVFFFRMIYPFRRVGDPRSKVAAAAGGCILLRRDPFRRSGGLLPIRREIIDDCALGRQMKRSGSRIHLSLSREIRSIRPGGGIAGMWHSVTRTACDQLGYRWDGLIGCVMAMTILYLWPPMALLWIETMPWTAFGGALAWSMMSLLFLPMARLYSMNPLLGVLLPLGAALFTMMTIASFCQYGTGRGHRWKGRTYRAESRESTS